MAASGSLVHYLQSRELGGRRKRHQQQFHKDVELFLEDKAAKSGTNQSCVLVGEPRSTFLMEFSPDGTCVASTHGDHTVRVTEVATGKCIRTLRGHPRTPWCLAYHPSSNHILASGCLSGQVRIWDLYGGGCEVWQTDVSCVIASMCFHPVDHVLVFAAGHAIYFWDWSKAEPFAKCETRHRMFQRVRWVKFDSLGHYLYTGISNNTTMHQNEVSRSSSSERTAPGERPRLSNIYNNFRNCFNDYCRDQMMHQLHPQMRRMSRLGRLSQTNRTAGVGIAFSNFPGESGQAAENTTEDSNERELLHSPVHEEGLNYARQYASHITSEIAPGLEGARNYAASVTNVARGLGVHRSQPLRGVWSPPPSTLPQIEDEEGVEHQVEIIDTRIPNSGFHQDCIDRTEAPLSFSLVSDRGPGCNDTASTSLQQTVTTEPSVPLTERSESHPAVERTENMNQSLSAIRDYDTSQSVNSNVNSQNFDSGSSANNLTLSAPKTVVESSVLPSTDSILNTRGHSDSKSGYPYSPMLTRFLQVSSHSTVSQLQSSGTNLSDSRRGVSVVSNSISRPIRIVSSAEGHSESTSASESEMMPSASRSNLDFPQTVRIIRPDDSATEHSYLNTSSGTNSNSVRILSGSSEHVRQNATSSLTGLFSHLTSQVPSVVASTSSFTSIFQNMHTASQDMRPRHITGTRRLDPLSQFNPLQHSSQQQGSSTHAYQGNRVRYSESSPLDQNTRYMSFHLRNNNARQPGSALSDTDSRSQGHYHFSHSTTTTAGRQSSAPLITCTVQANSSCSIQGSSVPSQVDSHLNSGAYFQPISEDPSSASTGTDIVLVRHSAETLDHIQPSTGPSVSSPSLGNQSRSSVNPEQRTLDSEADSNTEGDVEGIDPGLVPVPPEIQLQNLDDNNNTIRLMVPRNEAGQTGSFEALRDNFVNMTDRIEREMDELNRRIHALRQSFNESLQALRQDRERYRTLSGALGEELSSIADMAPSSSRVDSAPQPIPPVQRVPVITVTSLQEPRTIQPPQQEEPPQQRHNLSQPRTLLESSLRSHHRGRPLARSRRNALLNRLRRFQQSDSPEPGGSSQSENEPSHWRTLQRHYLHPDYSSNILDDTINRPNNALQAAIDRAIAGAFMGTGEPAVANNIRNQTHRIQYWDFSKYNIPDISSATENIVVPHCKLHNDTSCDISKDGTLLATFVPSPGGFLEDNILAVYSLEPRTRGQCLYTKSFGSNAISVSISPRNQYVMLGLTVKQLSWIFTANQLVAQVFKLEKEKAGEMSMSHVWDVLHPCNMDIRSHVGVNSSRWLPIPGQGLVYGTNKGNLHFCRPGVKVAVEKMGEPNESASNTNESGQEGGTIASIRQNLRQMLGLSNANLPRTINISTQTHNRGIRRSASTQTNHSDSE